MEISEATTILAALAQETRLSIFRLLVTAGPDGLAAGDIASRLETPAATLSFHLAQLSNAGLIQSTRQSRSIIYSLNEPGTKKLFSFLLSDCCKGRPELCSDLFTTTCC